MAYDKVVDSAQLDGAMTSTANAIRAKSGGSGNIPWNAATGFADAVAAIPSGGAVQESDINFYDYDGTLLHAWTLAELAGKTALPELPTREGLTCQGWNWTLAELKEENGPLDVGANYITDDGKTRIYIHLEEGRTSPMLGIGTNGTILVDWGDGSTPDALTGENAGLTTWSPTHNYPAAGDYVIQLTRQSGVLFLTARRIPRLAAAFCGTAQLPTSGIPCTGMQSKKSRSETQAVLTSPLLPSVWALKAFQSPKISSSAFIRHSEIAKISARL